MKTDTLKFEPILLEKNEERIESGLKAALENAKKLNESLDTAMEFVDGPLTDQEKEDLLQGGFSKAMEIIRGKYQFPKADDDFNLKSMGKDPLPAKNALVSSNALFKGYKYKVENGKVTLTEEGRNEIIESLTVYTKNIKQNEAFKVATDICDKINDAYEQGFVDNFDQTPISKGLKFVRFGRGERPFEPDPNYIRRVSSTGGIDSFS
ncbi:hypothetical protein [Xanthomarina gelatinilytica]|uniref:hypothetical protein n=1 Tax=Xanthomarina gelatinilytica TaxID=1137281 RepID=UPI003AA9C240